MQRRGQRQPGGAAEDRQRSAVPATFPTARPRAIVAALLPLPPEVAGLRIVDVGAGGSDAVAALLARGADAYAVDPRYGSFAGLAKDVNGYLARQAAAGQLPQAREASAAGIAAQREAFRRFAASFQAPRTRRRYLAAVATALPFDAGSVDVVYSLDCITQYLDRDYELLLDAVREALRVLKPGGMLALAPFRDDVFALGYHAARQANQERLLAWLTEQGIIWRVDDLSPTGLTQSGRLVVVAP